ncbi:hypothetical protein KCU65_g543, partial [Aureobasidium melanogenum]
MEITRYRWADCTHIQHVDDSGQPVNWVEVKNPVNSIVDAQPDFDCPACEDPDVTQPGISIMPRVPESTRQSAPAQTTTLNPIVDAFNPSQPMPTSQGPTTSANDNLAAQQVIFNPYELTAPANDVQQEMVNPYTLTFPADNYLAAQQTIPNPYESAFSTNNYFDAQQAIVPYASTVPHNDYLASHQQLYDSAGQVVVPPFYGPTGPMDFASTAPTSGPTNQLASASINTHHSPKNTKPPKHKPGKECPEGHPNCHWHYTDSCHKNPATCTIALQAIKASFHAHGEWRHAPAGWNEAHKSCIRVENPVMCPFHAELARSVFGSSCR